MNERRSVETDLRFSRRDVRFPRCTAWSSTAETMVYEQQVGYNEYRIRDVISRPHNREILHASQPKFIKAECVGRRIRGFARMSLELALLSLAVVAQKKRTERRKYPRDQTNRISGWRKSSRKHCVCAFIFSHQTRLFSSSRYHRSWKNIRNFSLKKYSAVKNIIFWRAFSVLWNVRNELLRPYRWCATWNFSLYDTLYPSEKPTFLLHIFQKGFSYSKATTIYLRKSVPL